ncbi:MAG: FHA domain-containing protein [Wenzhouxiangellaceae bacterium]|nr:FHA domain-containing protein [Wenzhouxiangellaceae bacterium]MBS3823266.1 FHA domain-containing protein [Wenzhouxiangellaceae bacterium]
MKGESENRPIKQREEAGRTGPQGTQLFSRDQIAEILENDSESDEDRSQARLVLLTDHSAGHRTGKVFGLSADRVTVGRSSACDVCIEEPSMSSEHARLAYSDDAWRVINLLSTNGVYVNDEKVFSHRLADGDEIRMGRVRLRFHQPISGKRRGGPSALSWLYRAGWLGLAIGAAVVAVWLLQ